MFWEIAIRHHVPVVIYHCFPQKAVLDYEREIFVSAFIAFQRYYAEEIGVCCSFT